MRTKGKIKTKEMVPVVVKAAVAAAGILLSWVRVTGNLDAVDRLGVLLGHIIVPLRQPPSSGLLVLRPKELL